ncbi:MAG TPA: thioredoxin family protein [Elusimicrobia bacterium]|nr:MAG: redox-active disulfide protein 2 [Elusimicrobia bacterium GWA2_64_40]OGR66464.1 MAG: redox-active disulfide protein 2 [Elusimicrobia bacterium GWB2_63_16]HAN03714.1 thioredoxin family protein [Elusimicrobiota bacterium]HAU89260.1 thioredoxin family protein [Elusimicrobiota bacterium]
MKTIQIFGGGCAKCGILYQHAEAAAKELGMEYRMEKVSDYEKIAEAGIMATPALAVDGKLMLEGRVPTIAALKELLK